LPARAPPDRMNFYGADRVARHVQGRWTEDGQPCVAYDRRISYTSL
jgi:hypothetical protein